MRKYVQVLALMSVCLTTQAKADNLPIYGELKSGISFQNMGNISNDSGVSNPATVATTSQSNTVGVFGAAVGVNFVKFGAPVRAEVEYDYRTGFGYSPNPNFTNAGIATKSTNTLNTQTVLVNAFYDINTGTKFTPFVGGGLGAAINDINGTASLLNGSNAVSYSSSSTSFAWDLSAGVNYAVTEHWSIDASYRYLGLGKTDFGPGSSVLGGDISSNEVLLGLRYQL